MELDQVLDRHEVCGLCGENVRRTYPLTHYEPLLRRWRPVRACAKCLGPGDERDRAPARKFDLHGVRLDI